MLIRKQWKCLLDIVERHLEQSIIDSRGIFVTPHMKEVYEEIIEEARDLIVAVKAEIECLNILEKEEWTPVSTAGEQTEK